MLRSLLEHLFLCSSVLAVDENRYMTKSRKRLQRHLQRSFREPSLSCFCAAGTKSLFCSDKTREGCNCRFRKTPRTEGRHKVQGSVDPMFAEGSPFLVPEILEFKAFRDSRNIFQQFSRNFSGALLQNSRKDPRKQPQPSRVF